MSKIIEETLNKYNGRILFAVLLAACLGVGFILMSYPKILHAGINWHMSHEGIYDIDEPLNLRINIYEVDRRWCRWKGRTASRSNCIREFDICVNGQRTGNYFTFDTRHKLPIAVNTLFNYSQAVYHDRSQKIGIQREDLDCKNPILLADLFVYGTKLAIAPLDLDNSSNSAVKMMAQYNLRDMVNMKESDLDKEVERLNQL